MVIVPLEHQKDLTDLLGAAINEQHRLTTMIAADEGARRAWVECSKFILKLGELLALKQLQGLPPDIFPPGSRSRGRGRQQPNEPSGELGETDEADSGSFDTDSEG
jgi:hypothetical protein